MNKVDDIAEIFGGVLLDITESKSDEYKSLSDALHKGIEITDEQVIYARSPVLYKGIKWNEKAFIEACSSGHLAFAQWLKRVRPNLNPRADKDSAFRSACSNGYLDVAKWLKYQWPDIKHRSHNDESFREACINGHLDVAIWLKTTWPDIDHRAVRDEAFRLACRRGHLNVAKWFIEQWPAIKYDLNDISRAIQESRKNKHSEMVIWLKANWPNAPKNSTVNIDDMFVTAGNKTVKLTRMLKEKRPGMEFITLK